MLFYQDGATGPSASVSQRKDNPRITDSRRWSLGHKKGRRATGRRPFASGQDGSVKAAHWRCKSHSRRETPSHSSSSACRRARLPRHASQHQGSHPRLQPDERCVISRVVRPRMACAIRALSPPARITASSWRSPRPARESERLSARRARSPAAGAPAAERQPLLADPGVVSRAAAPGRRRPTATWPRPPRSAHARTRRAAAR